MKIEELRIESPITQMLLNKASYNLVPMSGTFELTPMCNCSCEMCYVRKTKEEVENHSRKILTLNDWIRIAEEAKEAGMLYLLLTGGEPFVWPDFWKLYEKLSEMGFLISINTNGLLLDDQMIERLSVRPPIRMNVTLYGASDETYKKMCGVDKGFTRVERSIDGLKDKGITVKLNGTLTPANVGDLQACIEYAAKKDLIYEINTYMFPPLRRDEKMVGKNQRFTPAEAAYYRLKSYRMQYGEEQYHKFVQDIIKGSISPIGLDKSCVDMQDGKIRCRAGKASFWITWDGLMTPCGMMPYPTVDVVEKRFLPAWKELVEKSETLSLSGLCRQCANQNLCHACAAMAMAETGDTRGVPIYLCQMIEEIRRLAQKDIL